MTTTQTQITYVPKPGERITLRGFNHYALLGLGAWATLVVKEVQGKMVRAEHYNVEPTGTVVTVNLRDIEEPLGWQAVYDIECMNDEKAKDVLTWLYERGGIACWTSQDLSSAGERMYTPGDKSEEKPHWKMGLVEVVTDPARVRIFYQIYHSLPPTSRMGDRRRAMKMYRDRGYRVYPKHRMVSHGVAIELVQVHPLPEQNQSTTDGAAQVAVNQED